MKKITKVGNHLNLENGIEVILLELKNIPKKPGIYKMINSSDELIYICLLYTSPSPRDED